MGLNNLFEGVNYSNLTEAKKKVVELDIEKNIEEERRLKAELVRSELLEAQRRNHDYHRFVEDNIIIKWGPIDKK